MTSDGASANTDTCLPEKPTDHSLASDSLLTPKSPVIEQLKADTLSTCASSDNPVESIETALDGTKADQNSSVTGKTGKPEEVKADKSSKIIRQVEYYFSDSNLLRDKYLKEQVSKNDGWIEASNLLTFNRLRQLTTDPTELFDALQQSKSGLLELDREGNRLRRSPQAPPLPSNKSELDKRTYDRTVFVEGFAKDSTLNDIISFFVDKFYTDDVKLRKRINTKEFLGSVFVVFSTNEAAKSFVEQDSVDFDGAQLTRMHFEDFMKKRSGSKAAGTDECKEDRKIQKKSQAATNDNAQATEVTEEEISKRMVAGSVLFIDGLPSECTREVLKEKFSDHARVFADYDRGQKQAWLRFDTANTAQTMLDEVLKDEKELTFGENIKPTEYRVLKDEEERLYWKNVVARTNALKVSRKRSRRTFHSRNKKYKLAD